MNHAFSSALVASSIKHQDDVVPLTERVGRAKVFTGQRLAASHIDVGLDRDVGDAFRPVFVDDGSELRQVDVALEGVQTCRIVCSSIITSTKVPPARSDETGSW